MSGERVMRWFLMGALGAILAAVVLLSWSTARPFVGGGPRFTAVFVTLLLTAPAVGMGLALVLRRLPLRTSWLGALWWLAGVWLLVARVLHARSLESFEPLGLVAAVSCGFLLFHLPPIAVLTSLLFLDRRSPSALSSAFVARLLVGLLAAALSSGLLLGFGIAWLGVARWMTLAAIGCIACGTWILLHAAATRTRIVGLLVGGVATSGLAWSLPHPGPTVHGLRELAHTGTRELRVLDHDAYRYLLQDGEPLIAVDPATGDAAAEDPSTLTLLLDFFWPAGRALLVGLPDPQLVRSLATRGWTLTVAAPQDVVQLAERQCGLDAALFTRVAPEQVVRCLLQRHPHLVIAGNPTQTFEIIVVSLRGDALSPQAFATRQGVAALQGLLAETGILALRLEVPGWDHPWPRAVAGALLESFREVWALPVSGGPRNAGGLVLVASERVLEIRDHLLPTPEDHPDHPEAQLQSGRARNAWRYRFVPATGSTPVLTLDRNAAPAWLQAFHESDRSRLHHRLGGRTFTW